MKLGQKLQEFIYLLSTDDKYSEYDSRKSFNRVNKPDTENLLGVYTHHNQSSLEMVTNHNYTNTNGSNRMNDIGGGPSGSSSSSSSDQISSIAGVHEMKLAWRHIKHWLIKNAPDMNSSLLSKCTSDDLVDFQKDLNIRLPLCVSEFFKITDGQSNFSSSLNMETNGLIFGLKLMSLDEIMIQTENWRKVSDFINNEIRQQNYKTNELDKLPISHANMIQHKKTLGLGVNVANNISPEKTSFDITEDMFARKASISSYESSSSSSNHHHNHHHHHVSSYHKMPKQRSIPPGTIHETFAHPMWIPMITDEVGNYIGIDLSPASEGTWGQVILFGRDFDFKFRIAETWGDFLLIFANDLEIGNWDIKLNKKNNDGDLFIGNEGELVFVDKESTLEIPYLEMLKRRALKKWMLTLESEENKDTINQDLLAELKSNQVSILSLQNKSSQSIDTFITNNLNLIDSLKGSEKIVVKNGRTTSLPKSVNDSKSSLLPKRTGKVSNKSPLSQVVTGREEEDEEEEEEEEEEGEREDREEEEREAKEKEVNDDDGKQEEEEEEEEEKKEQGSASENPIRELQDIDIKD
ncbi:hypothetical protein KGF56_002910 [Candida oxycetoniae]|uniref:Knr4/Smi1-like domain-containing protein n=1 Tax=Candida oxycetoniae TaxID=497107 RepID=A0AAI9SW96_9ASCO|nr:uncharacterized protein KGF56_002910 [Candida oxycetoniae]KAI3404271.2 hypothetical protein KGF56_002910 [Candida oxycetoniae]